MRKPKVFTSPFGHVSYALITTNEELEKFTKKHKLRGIDGFIDHGAQVHHFEYDDGSYMSVVLMKNHANYSESETYGLLAHEAVHIWQKVCQLMKDDNPSDEFEAYSVQRIVIDLIDEYAQSLVRQSK